MKTLLFTIAMMLMTLAINAQEIKPTDKVLKDTTINKVDYKLYVGSRGGKYVVRTAKSGKIYKQYIKK